MGKCWAIGHLLGLLMAIKIMKGTEDLQVSFFTFSIGSAAKKPICASEFLFIFLHVTIINDKKQRVSVIYTKKKKEERRNEIPTKDT